MTREDDQTLIDIRFGHDIFDPNVSPQTFSKDLAEQEVQDHEYEVIDDKVYTPTFMGFIGTSCLIIVAYVAWVIYLSS
jgi:hypothetical protein